MDAKVGCGPVAVLLPPELPPFLLQEASNSTVAPSSRANSARLAVVAGGMRLSRTRLPDVRRFRSFVVPFSDVVYRESVSRRRLIFGKRASGARWREGSLRPEERRDRMERCARIAAALSFRKMAARDGAVQRKAYRRVGRMPVLFCRGGRRRKISSHGRDMPQGPPHVRIRMHRACMRNGKCVLCIVAADDAKSGRMDNAVA